jgi:S-ribosylhomocysteine lyase
VNIEQLGWKQECFGEVNHQNVKAPYIRLSSYHPGTNGDVVYSYDLRVSQPNAHFIKTDVLHSFEHFLLAGFKKFLPNNFVCVAPMGCQTGFYLVLLNEGRANQLLEVVDKILNDIILADSVPYAASNSCGQWVHHNLNGSKELAKQLLNFKASWLQVL